MSKTLWEFDDLRQMLFGLIGLDFGDEPEKRIDDIREAKRKFAAQIVKKAGLRKSDIVLEVGSGCGFLSRYIAPEVKRLYCCDISEDYLEFAKKECAGIENISFHKIDSGHIDFLPPASVDAVFSNAVFIHLNLFDIFWYFHEFKRIVRPGGRVWFDIADAATLDPAHDESFLRMTEYYRKNQGRLANLKQWNSFTAVVNIAEYFGFQLAATEKAPLGNRPCLFLKTAGSI